MKIDLNTSLKNNKHENSLTKMINNPLENQTLETLDSLYVNEKFEEHCSDAAKELAKDNNLNPDYYEPFIEFYIEQCRESDRGYFFGDQKYMIDLWWDLNKDLYEDPSPYEDYEPTDQEMMSSFGTKWHDKL